MTFYFKRVTNVFIGNLATFTLSEEHIPGFDLMSKFNLRGTSIVDIVVIGIIGDQVSSSDYTLGQCTCAEPMVLVCISTLALTGQG